MSQTCPYCDVTFTENYNYTKHLRYYAKKRDDLRKGHPAADTTEFDILKKQLAMWEMPKVEEDEEKQEEAKQNRRSERNFRHHKKKVSKMKDFVKEEINRAM
jgi:hypothetical protein